MEPGQTYQAEIAHAGELYGLAVTPFLSGGETKYKVLVKPGDQQLVFAFDVQEIILKAYPEGVIDTDLEEQIAHWIEGQDA